MIHHDCDDDPMHHDCDDDQMHHDCDDDQIDYIPLNPIQGGPFGRF